MSTVVFYFWLPIMEMHISWKKHSTINIAVRLSSNNQKDNCLFHCQDLFVCYGLIMPNVYNDFQYSHYMHWSLVGFALPEDNNAKEYQYTGCSNW